MKKSRCKDYIADYIKKNPNMKEGGLARFMKDHDLPESYRKPDMWCIKELPEGHWSDFEIEWHEVVHSNDLTEEKIDDLMWVKETSDIPFRFIKHDLRTGVVFEFGKNWGEPPDDYDIPLLDVRKALNAIGF